MSRILVFTGKGGVGKTSIAAAHARQSALENKKTLIVSTDMAHNLGDIFQKPFGRTVTNITDNLDGLEIDPHYIMEYEFSDMRQSMINLISASGMPIGEIENIAMFPGQDELFSLLKILEIYQNNDYERIIVDCAPTGETLSLLKFPEMLSWYIEKFLPIGKVVMRVLSPVSKAILKIQLPDKAAMTDIEKLFIKIIQLQELLKNDQVTSIRLVAIPEKMVVEETKRSYMYMNLYDFHVDGIYINRILPKDIDNTFFEQWIVLQNQYVEELKAVFGEVPSYEIPWFDCDINGLEGIDKIVNQVLDGRETFEVIDKVNGEYYIQKDDGYELELYLPFVEKADVTMHESGTDIIVKIGNFKRSIAKPNSLRGYVIASATFDKQILRLSFDKS